jgi:hypothetical protein
MSLHEHVDSLRTKHAQLDRLIEDEVHRPMPDQVTISRLKREKLKLKEQIEHVRPNGGQHGAFASASA